MVNGVAQRVVPCQYCHEHFFTHRELDVHTRPTTAAVPGQSAAQARSCSDLPRGPAVPEAHHQAQYPEAHLRDLPQGVQAPGHALDAPRPALQHLAVQVSRVPGGVPAKKHADRPPARAPGQTEVEVYAVQRQLQHRHPV